MSPNRQWAALADTEASHQRRVPYGLYGRVRRLAARMRSNAVGAL